MKTLARRGFLQFLGVAPIAAPVALRESINEVASNKNFTGVLSNSSPSPTTAISSDYDWAKQRLSVLGNRDWISKKRKEWSRSNKYDDDIASFRSFSLSGANYIQAERYIEREIEHEKSWLSAMIDEEVKKRLDII